MVKPNEMGENDRELKLTQLPLHQAYPTIEKGVRGVWLSSQ